MMPAYTPSLPVTKVYCPIIRTARKRLFFIIVATLVSSRRRSVNSFCRQCVQSLSRARSNVRVSYNIISCAPAQTLTDSFEQLEPNGG